ncbi:tyrosine-type recombinase/integrase [Herbiconiux solani]|uniref:tyrosine-type recombinase/integrase n=1 Tax=Herbiconiux solani TaxID=661329 RepID=UPI000824C75D|nr:tyrosine-type recombinase/integrase [Herbiconiux solani]
MPLETWGKIRRTVVGGKPTAVTYYRNSTGKRLVMQRSGKSHAQAERALLEALRAALSEDPSEALLSPTSTVAELAHVWLEERKLKGTTAGTINTYRNSIRAHIEPGLGSLRIREATTPRLDKFIRGLMRSNATARTARTVLMQMFALAVRHGAVQTNPAAGVIAVTATKKLVKVVGADELRLMRDLFREYDKHHVSELYEIAQVLTATGARIGEELALDWDTDTDLDKGRVFVNSTLITDGGLVRQDHPKSFAGHRGLTLPRTVHTMLLERRVHAEYEMVFPSSTGTYRWPANVRRQWRDALKGTPLAGKTPRDYRKAVATHLDRKLGVKAAAAQLGHGTEDITIEYYIEKQETISDFSEVIETLFESSE